MSLDIQLFAVQYRNLDMKYENFSTVPYNLDIYKFFGCTVDILRACKANIYLFYSEISRTLLSEHKLLVSFTKVNIVNLF